jgi:TIR domain/Trypsin-like peptidase domain
MAVMSRHAARQVNWLRAGLLHARRVAKVSVDEHGTGSGLLLDGELVAPDLGQVPLLLTVGHVLGVGPPDQPARRATALFEGLLEDAATIPAANVERVLIASGPEELHFTLALLDRFPGVVPRTLLAPRLPRVDDQVFIFGHPGAQGLALSIDDNNVVSTPARRAPWMTEQMLYYRAPTEGGSSGSPVFNHHWELCALHVGGSRVIGANAGVPIGMVIETIQARFKANPSLLSELREWRPKRDLAKDEQLKADYFSVFISYNHADAVFAARLHDRLVSQGIRTWLDQKTLLPGDDIAEEVARGITGWDKVLLCASQHSLRSWWVDHEIERTFQKERDLFRSRGRKVLSLVPLMLDDFLLQSWESAKALEVRSRIAADFRLWQDESHFEAAFAKLLAALRAGAHGRQAPPEPKL